MHIYMHVHGHGIVMHGWLMQPTLKIKSTSGVHVLPGSSREHVRPSQH